jgi:hypothetical protein
MDVEGVAIWGELERQKVIGHGAPSGLPNII